MPVSESRGKVLVSLDKIDRIRGKEPAEHDLWKMLRPALSSYQSCSFSH